MFGIDTFRHQMERFAAVKGSSARLLFRDGPTYSRTQHISNMHSMRKGSTVYCQARSRRKENVNGDLFVDDSCINCDTCRWMVPEVFSYVNGQSAVTRQPVGEVERLGALQAAVACPTGSIRSRSDGASQTASRTLAKKAAESFPKLVRGAEKLGMEIYHLGYHSAESYGATPYLIHDRVSGITIMVDTPRFNRKLVNSLKERFGGVDYIYLTHADDVAEHAKFSTTFGKTRRLVVYAWSFCLF